MDFWLQDSPAVIQASLHPRTSTICVAFTLSGLGINLLSSFWPGGRLRQLHNIAAVTMFVLIFVFVAFGYGATLAGLVRPGPRPPQSIRVFRDRLLVLVTYLIVYLALWTVKSLGGTSLKRPLINARLLLPWLLDGSTASFDKWSCVCLGFFPPSRDMPLGG
jgi:hypothetical protein